MKLHTLKRTKIVSKLVFALVLFGLPVAYAAAPAPSSPSLSYPAPSGVRGTAYNSGTNPTHPNPGPETVTVSAGSLPDGLTLDPATGALTGIPTTPGSFSPTFTVTDVLGNTGTVAGTITIAANTPLSIGFPTTSGTRGTPYSSAATPSGGIGADTVTVDAVGEIDNCSITSLNLNHGRFEVDYFNAAPSGVMRSVKQCSE